MNTNLWNILSQENLVTGNLANKPNSHEEKDSPWVIKILLGFSGWLAAIFILGFFVTVFSAMSIQKPPLILIGTILIVVAFFMLHRQSNFFLGNLALAISLAGQSMFTIGLFVFFRFSSGLIEQETPFIWFIFSCLQLFLAIIMPSYIHRVFSAFLAAIGFASTLYLYQNSMTIPALYGAFLMLVTAVIWLNEFRFPKHIEKRQAIAYGLVLALIALKGTNLFMDANLWNVREITSVEMPWFQPWMSEMLLSAVMVFVVWNLLQKTYPKPSSTTQVLALIGALLLSLLSIQAQGITVGVMIVLLGFSASNRILIGLGVISLLFYISSYYYLLEISLLNKSITLFSLGIGLIVARWIISAVSSNKQGAKV